MIDQKEGDFEASSSKNKQLKPPSIPTASTWSRFKDPRVVRVSQALGGKDRHSKVCTVRGLRDRRVRLSVPTAIQLYDLQERLGLNQPSKVVDWLLNAAKSEIDELPPLQIPQGMFAFGNNQNLDQPMLNFQEFRSGSQLPDKQGLNQEERHAQFHHHLEEDTSSSYSSIFKPDPPNLTLSQTPRVSHSHVSGQHEDWHGFGLLPFQPTLSVPSGPHQVLVYHQPAPAASGIMCTQSYLPLNGDLDPKQVSFQRSELSTSSFGLDVDQASQPVRQIHFNMTANLLPLQENDDDTEA